MFNPWKDLCIWTIISSFLIIPGNIITKIIGITIFVIVFLFILRLPKATNFLVNYKLTKDLTTENIDKTLSYIKFAYKNVFNKAIIDFWYFLIWILVLIFWGLAFWILYLLTKSLGLAISIWILIWIITAIYIWIKYYFWIYHCFELYKFNFKTFLSSSNISKWHFWKILGNLIIVSLIVWILAMILNFVLDIIFAIIGITIPSRWRIFTKAILEFWNIHSIINHTSLSLFWFWYITYILIKILISTFTGILWIIYFYIYYKHLSSKNQSNNIN